MKPAMPEGGNQATRTAARNAALMVEYLLAREAMASADPAAGGLGERLALRVGEEGRILNVEAYVIQTGRDLAEYRARRAGAPAVASAGDPGLASWSPRNVPDLTPTGDPRARPIWAESAGTVAHLAGNGGVDFVLSRYPLAGTFEFSVDASRGGWNVGTVGYGGVYVDPGGRPLAQLQRLRSPDQGGFDRGPFSRITIRVAPGRVSYLVNGHLFYEDTKATATSPWLGLGATSVRQAAFRNATLAGRPEIPRQVNLAAGDGLDGWDVSTYGESAPHRRSAGVLDQRGQAVQRRDGPVEHDWQAVDGEIRGRKVDPTTSEVPPTATPASASSTSRPKAKASGRAGSPTIGRSRMATRSPSSSSTSPARRWSTRPSATWPS